MAQKHVTVYVDDITGKELPEGNAETVLFGLDGVQYEIDTDRKAAERLRGVLAPYVNAGRRTGGSRGRNRPVGRTHVAPDSKAVRVWAAANGIQVSPRGRIPAEVVSRYRAAGN
jgi:hypothetical protein